MINLFNDKSNCCGCSACFSICPKNAITMQPDEEGFLYPHIDAKKCIECGLCKKVCAFQAPYDVTESNPQLKVYAVKHRNEDIRQISTSGGAFTAFSDVILSEGGIIYGATFGNDWHVKHGRAQTPAERDYFRGCKYVQSDLDNIFYEVEKDLKQSKKVLFSGTPCQCAGLKNYLILKKTDLSNLFLVDIVCHGTPSPLLWTEHIRLLEKKHNSKIVKYLFRTKNTGWHSHIERVDFENGDSDDTSILSQTNAALFSSNLTLRPSCYQCIYTNLIRQSDITIGDFWGIENTMPQFDDNKGVSLALINSLKGELIFSKALDKLEVRISNSKACLQPQLKHPVEMPAPREKFWNDYYQHGYNYIIRKYANYNAKSFTKSAIKKILRKIGLLEITKNLIKKSKTMPIIKEK